MKIFKNIRLKMLCTTVALFGLITLQGQSIIQSASEISVDENTLKSYVGRYDYGQAGLGAVLLVTLENGQLYAQLTGQPKLPVYPSSIDEFYWKVVDAKVKFVKDDNGKVTHAIHNQNGMQMTAARLKDETPVTVDPAVFDKYIGKYDLGDNGLIVVSRDGDKLFGQGLNLPAYQLLPASETEYFLREVNARVTFKVNDEGTADSVIININGAESIAIKLKE